MESGNTQDTAPVNEKNKPSAGERTATIICASLLIALALILLSKCVEKENETTDVVKAMAACASQPNVTVYTYSGTEEQRGANQSSLKFQALERDRHIVDAAAKCRTEVLEFYSGTSRTPGKDR